VVTPSYNQGQFLEETLRSVLLQGYPNLEYLVMDGGSTDTSVEIIRRYAPYLDGWVSEADRGQSHAIEKGFAHATGDLLAWLNSDDLFLPGALFTVARRFLAEPGPVLVYGDAEYIEPDGQPGAGAPCAQPYDRRWMLEHSNMVPQPSAFFSRKAYREAGGLDENLHYTMDLDLWLRLGDMGAAVFIPHKLSQMRMYPEAKFQAGGRQLFAEVRRVVERHGGRGLPRAVCQRLAEEQLAAAFKAFSSGHWRDGRDELAYLFENAPDWQDSPDQLASLTAERAWRLYLAGQAEPLEFALKVSQHLPPEAGSPKAFAREARARLHAALAFHHWRLGKARAARQQAWLALRQDRRQWANRGLWSVMARSWLRLGAG
jgi:hypothetical protein